MVIVVGAMVMSVSGVAWGSIVVTGSSDPVYGGMGPDPWHVTTDLTVGSEFGVTTMTLSDGSVVYVDLLSYIGSPDAMGILATVDANGVNTAWTSVEGLYVGPHAEGRMTVRNGAVVAAGESMIGGHMERNELDQVTGFTSGEGTVTVSGADAQWQSSWLFAGVSGHGALDVNDGGAVTVTGDEDSSLFVGVASDGTGEVTVDGGAVTVSHDVAVGAWGEGVLNVTNGGQVNSGNGLVGAWDLTEEDEEPYLLTLGHPAGTGTVTVSGSGSQWNVADTMRVGGWGTGNVLIENGQVTVGQEMFIGGMPIQLAGDDEFTRDMLPNGNGTVTVTGDTGSLSITSSDTLYVGYSGTGTLDVNEGGTVTSESVVIGGAPDGVGTVTVDDDGSTLTADDIQVGAWGTGYVTVSGAADVTTNELRIGGIDAGGVDDLPPQMLADFGEGTGVGTLTVTGGGSTMTVDGLTYVGHYGTGTLDVNDGGVFSTGEMAVGVAPSSQGTVTIDGPGSQVVIDADAGEAGPGYVPGVMIVGAHSLGDVTVSNQGQLTVDGVLYAGGYPADALNYTPALGGEEPGGTGTVTVTDEGSTLTAGELDIGYDGAGILQVLNGATVTSGQAFVGAMAEGYGQVLVDDASDSWNNTGSVAIGAYGDGVVTVQNGGHVDVDTVLFIGGYDAKEFDDETFGYAYAPNGTGTVNVSGAGSLVEAMGLAVGVEGDGTLNILNGAEVRAEAAVVGMGVDGVGEVLVDGQGSTLRIDSDALDNEVPPAEGDGTVNVTNGGQIIVDGTGLLAVAGDINIGPEGEGTMTISGGQVTSEGFYIAGTYTGEPDGGATIVAQDVADPATGTVFVTGPDARLNVTGDFPLMVGYSGTGRLDVNDGGQVTADSMVVGGGPDATGTVNVDDGTINADWDIVVGAWGQGSMTISNGGQVTTGEVEIGGFDNSDAPADMVEAFGDALGTGTVTVTDDDSTLTITGQDTLMVGGYGTGTLNVQNGALVTTDGVTYIGGAPIELGDGEEFTRDMLPTGDGTVNVSGNDAALTLTGDNTLFVGYSGTGVLDINDTGDVTAGSVVVGGTPDANGVVIVSDADSTLTAASETEIGAWGTGHMTVAMSGHVTTGELYVGGFDSSGVDDLPQQVLDDFGPAAGTGTLTATQGGVVTVLGQAYVGYSGVGAANVSSSAQVMTLGTTLGESVGSSGTITVDGTGSRWVADYDGTYEEQTGEASGQIVVGKNGQGTLTITNGGNVSATDMLSIGGYVEEMLPQSDQIIDANGTVTVTGSDSSLVVGDLLVGATGTGYLNILNNATVTSENTGIGVAEGSHGEVVVSNTPGTWTNTGSVFVGGYGDGALTVNENGHVVIGEDLYIGGFNPQVFSSNRFYTGDQPNGTGTVTVTGEDAIVEAFGVGVGVRDGEGTLEILNGGHVDSQVAVVGVDEDSTGTVMVDGTGSTWHVTGSTPFGVGVEANGDGSLSISNGGLVNVDSADAMLLVGGDTVVGSEGQGTMTVSAGRVETEGLFIGGAYEGNVDSIVDAIVSQDVAPATGTLTVTGPDATLDVTGNFPMMVGYSGDGTLNVDDEAHVTTDSMVIGGGPGVTGTVNVDDAYLTAYTAIIAGAWGHGDMTISGGGEVRAAEVLIGGFDESDAPQDMQDEFGNALGSGSVTVTGTDSSLIVGAETSLYVGYTGEGTLDVNEGGYVESQTAGIGVLAGSSGAATVDGAGVVPNFIVESEPSTWVNTGSMFVGGASNGSLKISNGGEVYVGDTLYIGGYDVDAFDIGNEPSALPVASDPNGTGLVTVTGEDSLLMVAGPDTLYVGYSGDGTLDVNDGGGVSTDSLIVGAGPDVTGTLTVHDANSAVTASDYVVVGAWGQGNVTIAEDAQLETGSMYIGGFDPAYADPAMLETLGAPLGTGAVEVNDGFLAVYDTRSLVVGAGGTGSLDIVNGGGVMASDSLIGGYLHFDYNEVSDTQTVAFGGGTGTAAVAGENSYWLTDTLVVGTGGDGRLDITGGGMVNSGQGIVGLGADSVGQVTVSGTGSAWVNAAMAGSLIAAQDIAPTGTLIVGGWGQGDVLVENGGMVMADTTYIGGFEVAALDFGPTDWGPNVPAGTGVVTVTGTDSLLATGGGDSLYVGYSGDGTLNVLDGGLVLADAAVVGVTTAGNGLIVVDGNDSQLAIVGDDAEPIQYAEGDGEVIIRNGGLVTVRDPNALLEVGGAISVGSEGDGAMVVSNGALVTSESGVIGGYESWSTNITDYLNPDLEDGLGTVLVTGVGTNWEADNLKVGFSGGGRMDVNDGGKVMSYRAFMGVTPGSVGTASVSDPGTRWESGDVLGVGLWGDAELIVSNGAQVDSAEIFIGGAPLEVIEESHEHVHPQDGGIIIDAEARVNEYDPESMPDGWGRILVTGEDSRLLTLGNESLYVGYSGTGILDVNDGGYVESNTAGIGAMPDSLGLVTIGDAAEDQEEFAAQGEASSSTWYNSGSMFVAGYGDGGLEVIHDGQVGIGGTLYIGGLDFDEFNIESLEDYDPDGEGYVLVKDGGELEAYSIVAGATGTGSFAVESGGQAAAVAALVGFGPDSMGELTVDGEGSVLDLTPDVGVGSYTSPDDVFSILGVGVYGQGLTTIDNGGQLNVDDVVVGGLDLEDIGAGAYQEIWGTPAGDGELVVFGPNSQLNVNWDLCVGHTGTGVMHVGNGGHVYSSDGYIGDYANAEGMVSVAGSQSQWTVDDDLFVGYEGSGSLDVSTDARVVVGNNLYIGGDSEGYWGDGVVRVGDTGELIVGQELYVWETGILRGDGTITIAQPTTLYNYGMIAPGNNGIGTLTVNGSVVFEPNSLYSVQISNTTADQLKVNGSTTINGGTVRAQALGTIMGEHDYEIIDADSVTGEFTALDTALLDFSFTDANLAYDPNSVWLHIAAANFNDPNIARTYNQQQVGGALQQIAGEDPGNPITDALQDLPDGEHVRHSYNQLSGQTRPALGPLTAAGTSRFLGTVTSRLQTVQNGMADMFDRSSLLAMSGPDSSSDGRVYDANPAGQTFSVGQGSATLGNMPWGMWGRGFGLYGDRETESDAPGYAYNVYGGSVGLDYQFTDVLLGGLVVGMSDGDVDFAGTRDNTEFNAKHVGIYGSAAWKKWYVDSVASIARLEYDTERYVDLLGERLLGSFSGYELAGYAELGRNWQLAPDLMLQPMASVQYSYLSLGDYTETGGTSALSFDKQTHESVKGSLGARLTRTLVETMGEFRADAQIRGRWVHEFGDDRANVDTAFASTPAVVFNVEDGKVARDSAVLGVGLAGKLNKSTRVYLDYDTRINSDETIHLISVALQYRW